MPFLDFDSDGEIDAEEMAIGLAILDDEELLDYINVEDEYEMEGTS